MTSTPPPAPPTRDRLHRSGTDKMLGGVSGGLAEYSGIDVVLWRVGFLLLTLAGGCGLLVYALLWVLVPAGPAGPDDRTNAVDRFVERLHGRSTGG